MEFVFLFVVAALFIGIVALLDRNADLRWRLDIAEHDVVRWKEEAVKRGWKNPFEEICDSLRQSTEKLEAVAAQMRKTAEVSKQNAERLKEINANLKKANDAMRGQVADLEKAKERFADAGRQVAPAPRDRPTDDIVRKIEKDVAAGGPEKDRSKLN